MFGADGQRKLTAKPSLPLSPLFARLAFNLMQEIDQLRGKSMEPLVDGDFDSDLYTIHDKAIEKAMDRVETFDLHTTGDRKVFKMLGSARAFSGSEALKRKQRVDFTPRAFDCLQKIDEAIQARRYTGQGKCEFTKSVVAEMDAEDKAAEFKSNAEQAKFDVENKAYMREAAKRDAEQARYQAETAAVNAATIRRLRQEIDKEKAIQDWEEKCWKSGDKEFCKHAPQ